MADDEEGIVIVDSSGTEHHFPAGFDPKKAGGIVRYRTQAHPPSAEDFAPPQRDVSYGNVLLNAVKSLNPVPAIKALAADSRPEDVALGPGGAAVGPLLRAVGAGAKSEAGKAANAKTGWEAAGHAAATVLPLIGPAAASAGEDLGSGDTERIERGAGTVLGMAAPYGVSKVAPRVSPALATIGEQMAAKGQSVTAAARNVHPLVLDAAAEAAGHMIGAPPVVSMVARRLLAHALDSAKKPAASAANAGGRLVKGGSTTSAEAELASALDELRAPAVPDAVELPPPPELPPGYRPRTSVPEPVPSANAGGRLVPPQTPTLTQELTDALAEVREPTPPTSVTTPPPATLPPGYTPRATVPKLRAVPERAPAAARTPTEPAKQAATAEERFFHGSPGQHESLGPGSMFSDDPVWGAGYTTSTSGGGITESFTGKIHEIAHPKGPTITARSVHEAEGKLLDMAKQFAGRPASSLREAAQIVSEKTDLVAIVAKNQQGKVTGGIMVREAPVLSHGDPVEALRAAKSAGKRIPDNLEKALPTPKARAVPEHAPAAAKVPHKSPRQPPERAPAAAKRAYFLKSSEQIAEDAAGAGDAVTPSGSVSLEDLPASWQSHTGQDLFPVTGAEGAEIAAGLLEELSARGVSRGEAMAMVSKNKDIPTPVRAQLIRAIGAAKQGKVGAR